MDKLTKDSEIFKGKSLADVLSDIYTNVTVKRKQIDDLISDVKRLIKNIDDAGLIVPIIKEYLEISVDNNDQLIRMAAIIQKLIATTTMTGSDRTDPTRMAEEAALREELQKLAKEAATPNNKVARGSLLIDTVKN